MKSAKPAAKPAASKIPLAADVHIGTRVRLRRMMLGVSQERLGDTLGITFQQIQKYEKGTNRIGGSRLASIAEVLNVPVAFFFEEMPGRPGLVTTAPPADGSAEMLDFLRTREGIRINRAFAKIGDAAARSKLLCLAEAMAGMDRPDQDGVA
jgi:transcriptional regulator with XRE-family HTH domain